MPDPPFNHCYTRKLHNLDIILLAPLSFTGGILQLLLNHQSRTFAGQYKLAVILNAVLQAATLAEFVPAVLGRIDIRGGVSAETMAFLILLAVTGWQTLTLPNVSQTGYDEDEE
jgi:hypothetical protein